MFPPQRNLPPNSAWTGLPLAPAADIRLLQMDRAPRKHNLRLLDDQKLTVSNQEQRLSTSVFYRAAGTGFHLIDWAFLGGAMLPQRWAE